MQTNSLADTMRYPAKYPYYPGVVILVGYLDGELDHSGSARVNEAIPRKVQALVAP